MLLFVGHGQAAPSQVLRCPLCHQAQPGDRLGAGEVALAAEPLPQPPGLAPAPGRGTWPRLWLCGAAGGTCPAGVAGTSPATCRLLRASPASREGTGPSWSPGGRAAEPSRLPSRTWSRNGAGEAAPAGAGVSAAPFRPCTSPQLSLLRTRTCGHPRSCCYRHRMTSGEGETEARHPLCKVSPQPGCLAQWCQCALEARPFTPQAPGVSGDGEPGSHSLQDAAPTQPHVWLAEGSSGRGSPHVQDPPRPSRSQK